MRLRRLVVLALGGTFGLAVAVRAPERPRSVLVITIDTLRADAAGRDRGTPAIEGFLGTATQFTRARTVAPLTLPAHLSLFTGLSPARHGIHDNCAPPVSDAARRGFPLLAEEFREKGYATAAFVAAPVLHTRTGIGAGFERYETPDYPKFDATSHPSVPAETRVEAPLRWLESDRGGRPFFLWVHLYDPHAPYAPFEGDEARAPTPRTSNVAALYRGEVRRADAAVERILRAVPAETIVVIASDHGESLGEHGEQTHDTLCYGATLDAFLAVRAKELASGKTDEGPRSLCDVATSLRKWCGLPPREDNGRPLDGPPHEVVVGESLFGWGSYGWGQCFAATDGRYSLVESGPRLELFDRRTDPGERRPIEGAEETEAFERLDRAIQAHRAAAGGGEGAPEPVLGAISPYGTVRIPFRRYLDRRENSRLPDPVTRLSYRMRLDAANDAMTIFMWNRDYAAVERQIDALIALAAEEPKNPLVRLYLLKGQGWMGDDRKDARWHPAASSAGLEAMRLGYVDPFVLKLTVHTSLTCGNLDTMREALAIARDAGVQPDADCLAEIAQAEARFVRAK